MQKFGNPSAFLVDGLRVAQDGKISLYTRISDYMSDYITEDT